MIYLINDVRQHERHFWNCLYGVATQEQIKRILDGHKVTISDTIYQIVEEKKIVKNREYVISILPKTIHEIDLLLCEI